MAFSKSTFPPSAEAERRAPRTHTSNGDAWHDEVQQMFHELRSLPEDSIEFTRLRERIIERCLPLADNVARRYGHRGESPEDLLQVARVGLLNAVNRFDPNAGDFLGFAVPTVMGEVKRYFRDFSWSVRVPRRLKEIYPQLAITMNELAQELGRAPTPSELAIRMGIGRGEVVEAMIAGAGFRAQSIDFTSSSDDKPTIADRIGSLDPGIRFIEDREALRSQMATLPERLQHIIVLRFFESLSQDEIAKRIGISQMHVSRLLVQALALLREGMGESSATRSLAG